MMTVFLGSYSANILCSLIRSIPDLSGRGHERCSLSRNLRQGELTASGYRFGVFRTSRAKPGSGCDHYVPRARRP